MTGSNGTSYDLPYSGGTVTVTPSATTTYSATATNANGSATAQATVTVSGSSGPGTGTGTGGAPNVSISPSSSTISAGQSDTLTVTASGAGSVHVTGSNGTSYDLPYAGGTVTVTPSSTTTYTATATNSHGSTTAQITVTVGAGAPAVSITPTSSTITAGSPDTLTVTASNAATVKVSGSDGSTYSVAASGGSITVTPSSTTTYTAEATSSSGATASAETTVTVESASGPGVSSIDHVIFMLQENHTFDDYFGMLNPYREANGWNVGDDGKTYNVDGIDDKLDTISNEDDQGTAYPLYKFRSTCIDDDSSDWLASYGDVNRYDFLSTRPIQMTGFVHTAEGYDNSCVASGTCGGNFTDTTGERAMGYYDQDFLNYYYYMASQFAVSDRWFSPVASKSVPNRIAVFTGGTTQGLVHDPGANDHLPQLNINNIFEELDQAGVSWKIYYTVTEGYCLDEDDCSGTGNSLYPAEHLSNLAYANKYLYENPSKAACKAPTQASSVVGDSTNSFCIDPAHIAPVSQYFTDLTNGTLASFAFIEAGYGRNDEHPGSEQSVLIGQAQVASIVNAFMSSPEWSNSVFFLSYDEGGGPYDHVPPVPGHSNDFTDASLGTIPDIATIAVNPDSYLPCVPAGGTATTHCDLASSDPGAHAGDAAQENGFAAQLGFRLPNIVISPFTRKHYVSHIPMDHTAVIKFVENRFIGSSAHLTARDAAQPNLLDFFDFSGKPWATPPTPPTPVAASTLDYDPCRAEDMGP